MNDARMYKEEKLVDNYILKELKINNNYHYRQFLQQNADNVILKNQANYHGNKKYSNNNEEYILGNYYQKGSSHGYLNSDLKNLAILKRPKRIIIGSSHIEDDFIIPIIISIMSKYSDLKILYAPHEPSKKEINR